MTTSAPSAELAPATVAPGIGSPTLVAAFQATAAHRGDEVALNAFGQDRTVSWKEYADLVEEVAGGLAALGVGVGDTVALLVGNSPEFHVIDTAALHLGATPFSVYLTSAAEQIAYLFENAENRVVVCESRFLEVLAKVNSPRLEHVVVVDADTVQPTVGVARVHSLADVRGSRPQDFDFTATWQAVTPEDIATLIYTSGTTGPPKGVELTHANLMFVMDTCNTRFPFAAEGAAISYLPTAHAADRVFSHYLAMVTGWPITTVADPATVFGAVAAARPSWFLGVPRVWEKLRGALLAKFDASPNRAAMTAAIDAATRKVRLQQQQEVVPVELAAAVAEADQQIFAGLRTSLGLDRVALLMTGAAPIAPAVHEFFLALGLPLQEGFGMSETGALGFTNLTGEIRIGKVGLSMPNTEFRIAEDGEILLRGAHVMRGYRKEPVKTAEAIDADGWLHTGDIGTTDEDGWVSIIDRKKDLIINSAGKNMSPVYIESRLKNASPLIGQVIVIGDARPYNVALVVLDPDAARVFASTHGLGDLSSAELAAHPDLCSEVDAAVSRANEQLSRIEQIKSYRLLATEWLPDSDELTATMKLKRRPTAEKYAAIIDEIYQTSTR